MLSKPIAHVWVYYISRQHFSAQRGHVEYRLWKHPNPLVWWILFVKPLSDRLVSRLQLMIKNISFFIMTISTFSCAIPPSFTETFNVNQSCGTDSTEIKISGDRISSKKIHFFLYSSSLPDIPEVEKMISLGDVTLNQDGVLNTTINISRQKKNEASSKISPQKNNEYKLAIIGESTRASRLLTLCP